MDKYRLIDYFDVWGDAETGFEVNNLCEVFNDLCIVEDTSNTEILDYLVSIGYLSTAEGIILVDCFPFLEIERECDGYPLGRLENISQ